MHGHPKGEYYMTLVETLIDHNYRHKVQLSKEKLQPVVSTITAETEYEE